MPMSLGWWRLNLTSEVGKGDSFGMEFCPYVVFYGWTPYPEHVRVFSHSCSIMFNRKSSFFNLSGGEKSTIWWSNSGQSPHKSDKVVITIPEI